MPPGLSTRDDIVKMVKGYLKLDKIPNGVIGKVESKKPPYKLLRPPIEESVRRLKAWLNEESQKQNANENYAKLDELIPFVDGAGSSKDNKWGKFLADVLHPWLEENEKKPKTVSAPGQVRSR